MIARGLSAGVTGNHIRVWLSGGLHTHILNVQDWSSEWSFMQDVVQAILDRVGSAQEVRGGGETTADLQQGWLCPSTTSAGQVNNLCQSEAEMPHRSLSLQNQWFSLTTSGTWTLMERETVT